MLYPQSDKCGCNIPLCIEAELVEVSECIDLCCPLSDVTITIPPCASCFKATVDLKCNCPSQHHNCICKPVNKKLCLPDLFCVEDIHACQTVIRCDKTCCGVKIIAGYNLVIKYVDCNKKTKIINTQDNIIFDNVPCCTFTDNLKMLFKNISYNYNNCGVLTVCFDSELCCNEKC